MVVRRVWLVLAGALFGATASCGPAQDIVSIIPEQTSTEASVTDARPLKLFVVIGASQTMSLTDPNGTRASATISLISHQSPKSSVLISTFSGKIVSFLTPDGTPLFTQLSDATASDMTSWQSRLLESAATSLEVDFVTPLRAVQKVIAADIATEGTAARYEVVFVSDTGPSNQDAELLCSDLLPGFARLSDMKSQVHVNTVMLNQADVPSCGATFTAAACAIAPADDVCPASIFSADEERLARIATLGSGTFHAFRHGDFVDFAAVLKH